MANLQTDKVDLGDWLPLSSAPRDNTLLLLLVSGGENMTEDAQIWITIGGNSLEHTGEDIWKMAGWDWCFDQFTVGDGEPIGWLPLPSIPTVTLRSAIAPERNIAHHLQGISMSLIRFLRFLGIARTPTDAELRTIGQQASERVNLAAFIACGQPSDPKYVDGAIVFFDSSGNFERFHCGFLSETDAAKFFGRGAGGEYIAAVPYSESPAHYRLDGWVWAWPPWCNASYCGSDKSLGVILDLGPVQAIGYAYES